MFAKLSILFFYRRIFNTGYNKAFHYTTIALAVFVILWAIGFFFAVLFHCGTNISVNWGTYDEETAYCVSNDKLDMCLVVMDVFADLVLFILPIPLVWTRLCLRCNADRILDCTPEDVCCSALSSTFDFHYWCPVSQTS